MAGLETRMSLDLQFFMKLEKAKRVIYSSSVQSLPVNPWLPFTLTFRIIPTLPTSQESRFVTFSS